MTFDISQFELKDTAEVAIDLADGTPMLNDGKPVIFKLYGPGSKEYVNANYKLENSQQLKLGALVRGKASKNSGEENFKEKAKFLAECTAEIVNFPLTPLEVYTNHKLSYITKQIDKELANDENFM